LLKVVFWLGFSVHHTFHSANITFGISVQDHSG